jgi:hypothetical protein
VVEVNVLRHFVESDKPPMNANLLHELSVQLDEDVYSRLLLQI